MIQAILRRTTVAITQVCYIKTARVDAVAAVRQLSAAFEELQLFSTLCSRQGAQASASCAVDCVSAFLPTESVAEGEGFCYRRHTQVMSKLTDSDNIQCSCGLQEAPSRFYCFRW